MGADVPWVILAGRGKNVSAENHPANQRKRAAKLSISKTTCSYDTCRLADHLFSHQSLRGKTKLSRKRDSEGSRNFASVCVCARVCVQCEVCWRTERWDKSILPSPLLFVFLQSICTLGWLSGEVFYLFKNIYMATHRNPGRLTYNIFRNGLPLPVSQGWNWVTGLKSPAGFMPKKGLEHSNLLCCSLGPIPNWLFITTNHTISKIINHNEQQQLKLQSAYEKNEVRNPIISDRGQPYLVKWSRRQEQTLGRRKWLQVLVYHWGWKSLLLLSEGVDIVPETVMKEDSSLAALGNVMGTESIYLVPCFRQQSNLGRPY